MLAHRMRWCALVGAGYITLSAFPCSPGRLMSECAAIQYQIVCLVDEEQVPMFKGQAPRQ
jgi:hypothetical protein